MSHGIKISIEENYTNGKNNLVSSHQVFMPPKAFFNKMASYAIKFARFSEQYNNVTHYTCDGNGGYIIHATNKKDLELIQRVVKSISPFTIEDVEKLKEYAGGVVEIKMSASRIYFDAKSILNKDELFAPLQQCSFGDVFISLINGIFVSENRKENNSQVKEIIDNILTGELIKV